MVIALKVEIDGSEFANQICVWNLMAVNGSYVMILLCISCSIFFTIPCHSATIQTDTLPQGQQLKDWEYLVSEEGIFKLGFFSPGNSRNRYLGIWCDFDINPMKKEVWVANRNTPISDSSGILLIDEFGHLKISYSAKSPIILSSAEAGSNVSATLLDSGNFVVRELNSDGSVRRVLWQSFDYPTDTLLPGMKLGINFRTGQAWSLSSWVSDKNPAPGSFTAGLDSNNGTSQLIVRWRGNVFWTSGPWQNGHFEFLPTLPYDQNMVFSYVSNENEKYFMFSVKEKKILSSLAIYISGMYIFEETDGLRYYMCSEENEPGCVPEKLPSCRRTTYGTYGWGIRKRGFLSTDLFEFDDSRNISIFDCLSVCLANCSCVAYASSNDDGTGCKIWSKVTSFSNSDSPLGYEIYFMVDSSTKAKWWIWLTATTAGVAVVLTGCTLYFFIQRKHRMAGETDAELEMLLYELGAPTSLRKSGKGREGEKNRELQIFSYESVVTATDNFSDTNKIGEGGFGPVFKGKLDDNQEVAIKRLSRNSGQGVIEFKNEAMLISKLQHRNLVRLLGCCIQKEEKILIYEYMPNKSLDYFLFNSEKKHALDWKKRLEIIEGIVQGLLYLHKYSRLKIIHRDLKAGNILLDSEMNPKISDFGMARIVSPKECQANTKRVVGTYGYMSPEYAMEGIFSTKSDVFSFGVLLLEIISGRRNNSFYNSDGPISLIGYALELWRESKSLELMDSTLNIGTSESSDEVVRCIHVGLLCVEENPIDRPSMLDVIGMIHKEGYQLPSPKQPAFHKGTSFLQAEFADCKPDRFSLNKMSISDMQAR